MTLDEYQSHANATAAYPGRGEPLGLVYTVLGLSEVGEVMGKLKKAIRDEGYGDATMFLQPARRDAIAAELGDILWYVAQTATELGLDLDDVAHENVQKLRSRQERGVISGDGDNR